MNGHDYRADFKRGSRWFDEDALYQLYLRHWNDPQETPLGRFTYVVALVAYGHLEHVEHVLDLFPPQPEGSPRVDARVLISVVKDLLPLPDHLNPENVDDHEAIKQWLNANQHQLVWNVEKGLYEFC